MPEVQTEQPLYVLPQNKVRALLPKIGSLLFLGAIFYLGIMLNVSLLELKASQETTVKLIALIIVLILVAFGIVQSIVQSKPYTFYRDRITVGQRVIVSYHNLGTIEVKQSAVDKMFKTYSLQLAPKCALRNIPQEVQIKDYVQQLANYAKQNFY